MTSFLCVFIIVVEHTVIRTEKGSINLNQHLKERNNEYLILVEKEVQVLVLCLHFPSFVKIQIPISCKV